jgi:AraC-like DNA-binding protein
MRLSTAQQLLRQSKISLVDVAFKCGFSSQTHMNENLLAELGVLRSAVIRRMEGRKPQGAKFDAKYAYVADVCVTRFNEQIDEIERWRSSEIVGFSAARLRVEAREAELNQAIVELSQEDFLVGNFDLKSLFSLLSDRFYSEDFVLWLGAYETNGRAAAFQRLADVLQPINTLLETGLASIVSFRATASAQDADGNFITDWETVLGGSYATGIAVRWRTVRAWKSRMVIAERIENLPSSKP